jgi:hypothetical protein
LVKVAAEALGPATNINEEAPEGIFNGDSSEVGHAICPSVVGGQIHQEKTVTIATGAHAITRADVGTNHQ